MTGIGDRSAGFSSLVTGPADLVALADAKAFLRVDHGDDDDLITSLVKAAVAHLDAEHGILGRALVTQTWRLTLNAGPTGEYIALPVPPVESVTEIKYYDADNTEQAFDASNYRLVKNDNRAAVELVQGASWPVVYDRAGAFWVDYVAGQAVGSVPAPLVTAVKMLTAHWYAHREAGGLGEMAELPFGVRHVVQPFRTASALLG